MAYLDSPAGPMVIIHDGNFQQFINPSVAGETKRCGTTPRPPETKKPGFYAGMAPPSFPVVSQADLPGLIAAKDAEASWLKDIRMTAGPNGGMIPSRDQNGKGYCLRAGTLVTMASFARKPVEAITAGEFVRSHTDVQRKVITPTQRQFTGRMVTIRVGGYPPGEITTTDDHPFLTEDGSWKKASDFKEGELVNYLGWPSQIRLIESHDVTDETVYCLQVEGDHSFVANGIKVHNCWAHSGVSAHLLLRARMNEPYADLSAYAIACQIKNFADEGGWGAQGLDWQQKNGVPTSATWAQQSMSRSNVNDAMKAESVKHLLVTQIADMDAQEYDRNLQYLQYCTLFLRDCPCVTDFNWWSHSVCGNFLASGSSHRLRTRCATSHKLLQVADFDRVWAMNHPVTAGIGTGIWNSWGDSWSAQGMGILTGNQGVPDGGAGLLAVMAS